MLKSFGPTNIPSMPGTFNMFSKLFTASTLSIPIIAMLFLLRFSRYLVVASLTSVQSATRSRTAFPLRGLHFAAPITSSTWETVSQYGANTPCAPASIVIVT